MEEDDPNIDETCSLLDNSSKSDSIEKVRFCSRLFCCRSVLVFLQFCGFITVYGMRANLSVALVAMVNQTFAEQSSGKSVFKPECRKFHGNSSDDDEGEDGPFNWDQETQGYILSSFFYGYIVTQLPGGWLSQRYGGKKVLGYGIFMTALFTGLTPIAARTHVLFLIAVRVLAGFGEGVTYPAAIALWSRWATPFERSTYIVFSFTGGDFGAIFSLAVSGWLSSLKSFDDGWPLAFYFFGGLGIIWFIVWMALVYESPSQHPRIAAWEKQHILDGIGNSQDRVAKKIPTPWKSIFTSLPVWATFVLAFSYGWGWYVFLACLPSFFKEVLDFRIQENGALTALPFIASWSLKNFSARISDWLQRRYSCPTTAVRKMFVIIAFTCAASLLLPVGFLKCSQTVLSVFLLTMSCGTLGIFAPTGSTNPVDLSPRFSSVVMAVVNVGSNIPGILSPIVAGYLTNHEPTRRQWKKVFYITCSIYACGLLFYVIFGSGKEQSWNSPQGTKNDDEDDISAIIGRKELKKEFQDSSDKNDFENTIQTTHSAVI